MAAFVVKPVATATLRTAEISSQGGALIGRHMPIRGCIAFKGLSKED